MVLEEVVRLFLASRKHGTSGATAKARPSTLKLYEHWLGVFVDFMHTQGVTTYEGLRKAHMVSFLDWMEKPDGKKCLWAKATKLKVLRSLRSLFKFASVDEDCTDNDDHQFKDWTKSLGVIEKSPRREYIPTLAELRKFKAGFNCQNRWGHRDYVAFSLMLGTGMRIGEMCNLRLDGTKLDDCTLFVPTGAGSKTGSRLVPIPQDLARLIKGWLKTRQRCATGDGSEYLFVSKYTGRCTPTMFQKRFRQVAARVNVPELTPHSLRHAFCTYYLMRGGSMDKLRHIVGHADYRMLLDYEHQAKVGGDAMKAEMEKVSPLAAL